MSRVLLKRTAGDFGDTWTLFLQENDGSASDLTSVTSVGLHFRLEGDVAGVTPLRLNALTTVDADPTTGKVTYTFVDGDLDIAGKYYVQVEAIFPTQQITWDYAIVTVERQYG